MIRGANGKKYIFVYELQTINAWKAVCTNCTNCEDLLYFAWKKNLETWKHEKPRCRQSTEKRNGQSQGKCSRGITQSTQSTIHRRKENEKAGQNPQTNEESPTERTENTEIPLGKTLVIQITLFFQLIKNMQQFRHIFILMLKNVTKSSFVTHLLDSFWTLFSIEKISTKNPKYSKCLSNFHITNQHNFYQIFWKEGIQIL